MAILNSHPAFFRMKGSTFGFPPESAVARVRPDQSPTNIGMVQLGLRVCQALQRGIFESDHSALTQLRAYLAQNDYPADGRLPPERKLCEELGVTRTSLRKALATLELEGQIWRHVGRGTFIGARPLE